jgi:histidinol dehydrogenase
VLLRVVSATTDAAQVEALTQRSAVIAPEIDAAARAIIDDVRARGDAAVREYTARFDKRELGALELDADNWQRRAAVVAPAVRKAIEHAAARVRAFHQHQHDHGYELDDMGVRLALRVEPLARVGLYVPGGTARYPSSVIMTAVPARVAGVGELIMVTPGASAETLAAAEIAGVDRVFEIGGAQAVAALAYGTESVPRVDKIVGPGNNYVAAAKRLVFGDVDIDQVAGASEVLIIADDGADAELVAADLLAQAEHDRDAHAVLVTTSLRLARAVGVELERQLATLPRAEIARTSLERHGAAIVVADLGAAVRLANRWAPEHLELLVADARHVADKIRTAGAIFVGPWTPEAAGDYLAGPNHVLPTGGAARYGSPLGVYDFVKRTTVLEYEAQAIVAHAPDIATLAEVEGLDAHGRSATLRAAKARAAAGDKDEA